MLNYIRHPDDITRRSFEVIEAEADLKSLPGDIRPVAARIVHACGMPDVVSDLAYTRGAGDAGAEALRSKGAIVCDVRMVAAGLMTKQLTAKNRVSVAIDDPEVDEFARRTGQTRSAAGIELKAKDLKGSIVVIGNAPTALFRLLELIADGGAGKPALVLGFPVGFVGAAESKAALAANDFGLSNIALRGRRGGSAMAAAALNALILGANGK
jgi:precorrin-8X/cobalt-precorrin-8 methylmutase